MARLPIPDVLGWEGYFRAKKELANLKSPETKEFRPGDRSLNFDIGVQETFANSALNEAVLRTVIAGLGITLLGITIHAIATTPR